MRFSKVHILYCTLYSYLWLLWDQVCSPFSVSFFFFFFFLFFILVVSDCIHMGEAGPGSAIRIFSTQSCWAKLYAWNHLVVNSMFLWAYEAAALLRESQMLRERERAGNSSACHRSRLWKQEGNLFPAYGPFPVARDWRGGTVGFDILLRRCITGNVHLWMEEEAGLATWQLLTLYHFFINK